jgi:dTDP-4-dehydrorhamnose reductase
MSNVLIIGASGQVGAAIAEFLGAGRWRGTFRSQFFPGGMPLEFADVAQSQEMARNLVSGGDSQVMFICGGMTNVDACESDRETAFLCNRDAPARLARAARENGVKTVYFSTEYVFGAGGSDGPFSEDDPTGPLNVYGESKLAGENAVKEEDHRALVIRTTTVFGPEALGKNFAYQVKRAVVDGTPIKVAKDQVSNPTYNRDLARAAVALADAGVAEVVNVVGPDWIDRADFGRRLTEALGGDTSIINAIATEPTSLRARRPLVAGLKTDKLNRLLPGISMASVSQSLEHWRRNQRGIPF